jgi:hypothetical protein
MSSMNAETILHVDQVAASKSMLLLSPLPDHTCFAVVSRNSLSHRTTGKKVPRESLLR